LDLAGRIYQAAVTAADASDDLETVLPALIRMTRSRAALVDAIARCDASLAGAPDDVVARRARELLAGALGTSLFSDDDGRHRWT
jgi:hypothetical protein